MTKKREAQIRTVQRKMMRAIVATKRFVQDGVLEDWVDWIVRSTAEAERVMVELQVPDWVEEVHRRRFRWAGRTARLYDERWTREVLLWSATGSRRRGRPKMRWTDQLNKFFKQGPLANQFWMELAQDESSWCELEHDYVKSSLGRLAEL